MKRIFKVAYIWDPKKVPILIGIAVKNGVSFFWGLVCEGHVEVGLQDLAVDHLQARIKLEKKPASRAVVDVINLFLVEI